MKERINFLNLKDLEYPALPQSAFGIIIEALTRRRAAIGGKDGNAFTIMSCDNLRHNGLQVQYSSANHTLKLDIN